MSRHISIRVNGTLQQVQADEDALLLWVLRDELKITSPKFGCGMGICGACTVHLNGRAIRACVTPIGTLSPDHSIVTFEGLDPYWKSMIVQAWMAHDVPQCGYCQVGQMMGFAALCIQAVDMPREEDIQNTMNGHICRCGTYHEIRQAIQTVLATCWPSRSAP